MIEYPDLIQGTEEWLQARRGIITASTVGQLLTWEKPKLLEVGCADCDARPGEPCKDLRNKKPMKGFHQARTIVASVRPPRLVAADNDTSHGLILTLAGERITGHVEETFTNRDMQRGKEEEPFARDAYAAAFDVDVVELGFITDDKWGFTLGYSPDGLVGDEGLIEIKSRRAKRHIEIVLADETPAENMAQIQCGLLVSGRKWCDYVDFSNGMHLFPKRVEPDDKWFDAITEAACAAEEQMTRIIADYDAKCANLPATQRIIDLEGMRIA